MNLNLLLKRLLIMRYQKITALAALLIMLLCSNPSLGNYTSAHKNPDGTWVVGWKYQTEQDSRDNG